MIHIRAKALAVLIAVLALGVPIAVPGFAGAEEEAGLLAEESCPEGSFCVWPQAHFQGARGQTACSASGNHVLAGTKHSAKNRCASKGVGLKRNGEAVGCVGAGQNSTNFTGGFNEILVFESANC
jgi:hypothetical protein